MEKTIKTLQFSQVNIDQKKTLMAQAETNNERSLVYIFI